MKLFKKTVFWVLVLAVIAGSFYLFDKKSEEKKSEEEVKKRLFAFTPDDVVGFDIKRSDGQGVSVRMENDVWIVTRPITAAGDVKRITRFLEKLVNARMDGVLFEKAPEGKLDELGLAEPFLQVELSTRGGSSTTVSFGDRGPTHNISYAAVKDDPRIFRINTDVRADADKGVYDMRDKTVLPFDPTRVKSFDIKWTDGQRIVVEQQAEGKWNALGLSEGRTDFLKVMEMLVKLKKSEIKAFVEEDPERLEPYGLDKPRARLIFVDEQGIRNRLLIGGRDRSRRGYYAARGAGRNVFLLEEDLLDSIPRSLGELEEKEDEKMGSS